MNLKVLLGITMLITALSCATVDNPKTSRLVTVAINSKALLGEGAIWNHETGELYWIDIEGKSLHIFDPINGTDKVLSTPSRIGTVVPKNKNQALIALEDGVYNINLDTGVSTPFVDMSSELINSRLNDGKCDPSGRLWVGSMHLQQLEGKANLYSIDANGKLRTQIKGVTISNGIVWSTDSRTMYYIDTPTSRIMAYDFDDTAGTISNGRVAVEIPENLGYPDGMTIDEDNMLWVGMWNGNAVIRFNPKDGQLLQKIEVPAHNVTSCAFGGADLKTLYITTASIDMTDDELREYPLAGSVFKVVPGVAGVKSQFFK